MRRTKLKSEFNTRYVVVERGRSTAAAAVAITERVPVVHDKSWEYSQDLGGCRRWFDINVIHETRACERDMASVLESRGASTIRTIGIAPSRNNGRAGKQKQQKHSGS